MISLKRRSIAGSLALAAVCLSVPMTVETQSVALVHDEVHRLTGRADITAARSGRWSDPATWGGALPAERQRVAIPPEVAVTVDREVPVAFDWIRVDGTLRFAPDVDTRLVVETLVVMGRLEIGTDTAPVLPDVTARLVFRSEHRPISHDRDPLELTRGLIAMSPLSIVGSAKREISALDGFPDAGATTLTLEAEPAGWRPGDEVLVAPTLWGQDEVVKVMVVRGRTIEIAPPLRFTRRNVPNDPAVRAHVGNLTRNVVVQTDPSQAGDRSLQGHVMLMGGAHSIRHAAFLDTGRTTVRPVSDPIILPDGTRDAQLMPLCGLKEENVRGRYSLHFHNPGPASAPSVVEGAVIRVQRERGFKVGIQNHSAYVNVRRSIVHQIDGSGIFTEEGDERGEYVGNLVVHSLGSNADKPPQPSDMVCMYRNYPPIYHRRRENFGHRGAGIWLQGNNVLVAQNVFAGHDHAGIDHAATGLDDRKDDTFTVLVRPDHIRRGTEAWIRDRLGDIDPAKPQLRVHMPPLEVTDNHIYAIGSYARYGSKTGMWMQMQLGIAKWPLRPRNLLARNVIWNVGSCLDLQYSDWGRLEDLTCLRGHVLPGSRQERDPQIAVNTRRQNGRYWEYDRVRIDGFASGSEFRPSEGSTFKDVTINGQPYVPDIEACQDGVDNDRDGEVDEGCLSATSSSP